MIISHNQLHEVLRAYNQSVQKANKTEGQGKKPVAGEKPVIKDQLSLSPQAQELQRVAELAKKVPEVRQEKVAELKKQVAQGTYNVSGEAIAEKILARLVADELE